jgi:hypothetical protein
MTRPLPAEPLMTPKVAAGKLGFSIKTLLAHVASGKLRFIDVGTKTRRMYRFTEYNLTTFIENQKVRLEPPCPSSKTLEVPITGSTSKSGAVAFSAVPRPQTKKRP